MSLDRPDYPVTRVMPDRVVRQVLRENRVSRVCQDTQVTLDLQALRAYRACRVSQGPQPFHLKRQLNSVSP